MYSWWALYVNGILTAMGIGRVGRDKIIPWFSIALIFLGTAAFILIESVTRTVTSNLGLGTTTADSFSGLFGWLGFAVFLFIAVVGSEAVAVDRQFRTLTLYLVRPLHPLGYITARWASVATLGFAFFASAHLLAFFFTVLNNPDVGMALRNAWTSIPIALLTALCVGLFYGLLGVVAGSLASRRVYAAVLLLVLYFFGYIVSLIINAISGAIIGLAEPQLVNVFIHPLRLPISIGDVLLGISPMSHTGAILGLFFGIFAVALAGLIRRYMRITE